MVLGGFQIFFSGLQAEPTNWPLVRHYDPDTPLLTFIVLSRTLGNELILSVVDKIYTAKRGLPKGSDFSCHFPKTGWNCQSRLEQWPGELGLSRPTKWVVDSFAGNVPCQSCQSR